MKRRQCFVSNSSSSSYTIDESEAREDEDRFLLCGHDASDKILYLLRKIDEVSNMLSFGAYEACHPTYIALVAAYSTLDIEQTRLVEEATAKKATDLEPTISTEIPCPHCKDEELWDVNRRFVAPMTFSPYAVIVSGSCTEAPLYKCSRCGKLWQCFPDRGLVEIDL